MDLSIYNVEDLLLAAIKSEIEAREFYRNLSDGVKNYMLKDRLKFLSDEEEKHKIFFETLFQKEFPNEEMVLPRESPVPLPELRITDENVPLSEILWKGMQAEKAAYDFYNGLASRFKDNQEAAKALSYIALMEMGHYKLLEVEKENAKEFEDVDFEWPMMHIGP